MQTKTFADIYAVVAAAAFLLVTAWGNALAMFAVGVVGFLLGLLIFRKNLAGVGALVALVSCLIAAVVALALHHR